MRQCVDWQILQNEDCMAILGYAGNICQIPSSGFIRVGLIPKCVHKRTVFGKISDGSGRRKFRWNPADGLLWVTLTIGLKATKKCITLETTPVDWKGVGPPFFGHYEATELGVQRWNIVANFTWETNVFQNVMMGHRTEYIFKINL